MLESLLDEQHNVLALSLPGKDNSCLEKRSEHVKKNCTFCHADLSEVDSYWKKIADYNPDAMIHLAWEGIPDYGYEMSRRNLDNSIRLANMVMESTGCRKIIMSGSCWEYGRRNGICAESDKIEINSYFSWAKNSLNEYLNVKCRENKIDLKWLRLFYVYGTRQREKSLIPSIIRAYASGKNPDVINPQNMNDYVYINDVVKAFLLALMTETENSLYNVGNGKAVSVEEIARIIASLAGCKFDLKKEVHDYKQENFWADTARIRNDLGWVPGYSIEKGIQETVEYFKKRCC
jgi:nucleoside-diphosphate-sugar epimerase